MSKRVPDQPDLSNRSQQGQRTVIKNDDRIEETLVEAGHSTRNVVTKAQHKKLLGLAARADRSFSWPVPHSRSVTGLLLLLLDLLKDAMPGLSDAVFGQACTVIERDRATAVGWRVGRWAEQPRPLPQAQSGHRADCGTSRPARLRHCAVFAIKAGPRTRAPGSPSKAVVT